MNIHLTLDYQTILRNEPRPVHLVAKLTAQKLETYARPRSAAFAVVLDRSGSMSGQPLQLARESCAAVVRNLRRNDFFSLIVFDDSAQVVIPLQKPTDRQGMMTAIAGISEAGSTNLMSGWLLGSGKSRSGVASIHHTRTVGTGKRGKSQMSPIEIPKLWAGGPDSPFFALREGKVLPRKSFLAD